MDDSFTPETPVGNFGPYVVPEDSYFMLGGQPELVQGFQILEKYVCDLR